MIKLEFDVHLHNDGENFFEITLFKEEGKDIYINNNTGECFSVNSDSSYKACLERETSDLSVNLLNSIFDYGTGILLSTENGLFYGTLVNFTDRTNLCPNITISLDTVYKVADRVGEEIIAEYLAATYFILDESIYSVSASNLYELEEGQ